MTNDKIWRTSKVPEKLLGAVQGLVSDRQLRLFACACARLYWDRLSPEARQAVEAAERHLDRPATYAAMIAAGTLAASTYQVTDYLDDDPPDYTVVDALGRAAAYANAWRAAVGAIAHVRVKGATKKQQQQSACALMREVFGDPFAPPRVDPAWFAREGGIVRKLARSIYEERAFDRMPILGDALEEAGCHDKDILGHCRDVKAGHVRGCWVLELCLTAPGAEGPEPESTLILPRPAWLVTCRIRGRTGDPLPEWARAHLVPLLAKTDPEFVVARACPELGLHGAPFVRLVKGTWFVAAKDGVTLAETATGRVEDGPSGRAWLYTKQDKALADLAEVYEPVRVLMGLR